MADAVSSIDMGGKKKKGTICGEKRKENKRKRKEKEKKSQILGPSGLTALEESGRPEEERTTIDGDLCGWLTLI